MNDMTVRLTPWARERIVKAYCQSGHVTKTALRMSLRDFPDTEFHTVATPTQPRAGAVVTTREAAAAGFDELHVRLNNDRDLAIVVRDHLGQVVVR
jgi:hypothetical protein